MKRFILLVIIVMASLGNLKSEWKDKGDSKEYSQNGFFFDIGYFSKASKSYYFHNGSAIYKFDLISGETTKIFENSMIESIDGFALSEPDTLLFVYNQLRVRSFHIAKDSLMLDKMIYPKNVYTLLGNWNVLDFRAVGAELQMLVSHSYTIGTQKPPIQQGVFLRISQESLTLTSQFQMPKPNKIDSDENLIFVDCLESKFISAQLGYSFEHSLLYIDRSIDFAKKFSYLKSRNTMVNDTLMQIVEKNSNIHPIRNICLTKSSNVGLVGSDNGYVYRIDFSSNKIVDSLAIGNFARFEDIRSDGFLMTMRKDKVYIIGTNFLTVEDSLNLKCSDLLEVIQLDGSMEFFFVCSQKIMKFNFDGYYPIKPSISVYDKVAYVEEDVLFVAESKGNPSKFVWKFQDGKVYEGPTVMRQFKEVGDYWVDLTIENSSTSTTVRYNNAVRILPRLVAEITYDGNTDILSPTGFSYKTNTYTKKVNWDFGDGTFSEEATTKHRYSTVKPYLVKLTVSDEISSKSDTMTIYFTEAKFDDNITFSKILESKFSGSKLIDYHIIDSERILLSINGNNKYSLQEYGFTNNNGSYYKTIKDNFGTLFYLANVSNEPWLIGDGTSSVLEGNNLQKTFIDNPGKPICKPISSDDETIVLDSVNFTFIKDRYNAKSMPSGITKDSLSPKYYMQKLSDNNLSILKKYANLQKNLNFMIWSDGVLKEKEVKTDILITNIFPDELGRWMVIGSSLEPSIAIFNIYGEIIMRKHISSLRNSNILSIYKLPNSNYLVIANMEKKLNILVVDKKLNFIKQDTFSISKDIRELNISRLDSNSLLAVGTNFYNDLIVFKIDLKESYNSAITENNTNALAVFPNPATDKITVNLGDNQMNYNKIEIIDVLGNIHLISEYGNGNEFDVSALPNGLYMIRVSKENSTETLKFIKI